MVGQSHDARIQMNRLSVNFKTFARAVINETHRNRLTEF